MKSIQRIFTLVLVLVLMISSVSVTVSAAENLVHGIGFVTASSLRLRSEPNSTSAILDTAPVNDCVVILEKTGQWYKVNYNLQTGYMHEAYLAVSNCENAELGYGKITGNAVNLRTGPSTSYSVAAVSSKNETCYILGINEGWYKVIYKNVTAYIRSDYLELTELPYENKASKNQPQYYRTGKPISSVPNVPVQNAPSAIFTPNEPQKSTGADILTEAQKYLGARYLSGGASPSGFDCSGLVYYVLKQTGHSPNRTPVDQYQQGTYVEKSNLRPGDIVFFAGTGASGISHVGIYAGNGQFLHAPNSHSTVSYSDLTSGYWANHYYGARRMV